MTRRVAIMLEIDTTLPIRVLRQKKQWQFWIYTAGHIVQVQANLIRSPAPPRKRRG